MKSESACIVTLPIWKQDINAPLAGWISFVLEVRDDSTQSLCWSFDAVIMYCDERGMKNRRRGGGMCDMNSFWGGQPYQSKWANVICGGTCEMFRKEWYRCMRGVALWSQLGLANKKPTRCYKSKRRGGGRLKDFIFSSKCFDVCLTFSGNRLIMPREKCEIWREKGKMKTMHE